MCSTLLLCIFVVLSMINMSHPFYLWWGPSTKECQNGGVPRKMNVTDDCFCQGTKFYGSRCQHSCALKLHFNPHIDEKCLNGECKDDNLFYQSCLDIRFNNFNITRQLENYPKCQESISKICVNTKKEFFIEREIRQTKVKCHNSGVLRYSTPDSGCFCLGTHHWGPTCSRSCSEFGFEIKESCLRKNGACDIPDSCVDLSRPGVQINRCQHGVFLQTKHFSRCSCTATGWFGEFCHLRCPVIKSLYTRNNTEPIVFPESFPVDCIFR